ncbi:hypothetical protein [Paenibacillus sp. Marseille-Q4541]|uniref:hypothetical protein n=1 Tax=Paenibacillus sp. Marseille-Q4541 TaxID=2831522 RepID=UPI001BA641FD|nr:hypothetical protein [Paenibacillus sp. Marseille-Q4541]
MALTYVMDAASKVRHSFPIGSMEIIRYDVRQLPFFTLESRYVGLLKISCGGIDGFAEFNLPKQRQPADLIRWISVIRCLKGLQLEEAQTYIRKCEQEWGPDRIGVVRAALSDIEGKLVCREEEMDARLAEPFDRTFMMDHALTYYSF